MKGIIFVQSFHYIAKSKAMQFWFLLRCCNVVIDDCYR
jgi:hypothetical protein